MQKPESPVPTRAEASPFEPKLGLRILANILPLVALSFGTGCTMPGTTDAYPSRTNGRFRVLGTSPEDGAGDVPVDSPIVVTLSDRPIPESVSGQSVQLSHGGIQVPGRLEQSLVRCTLTILPSEDLDPFQLYQIHLSDSLQGWSGDELGKPFSASFTTSDATQGRPPSPVRITDQEVTEQVFQPHCACCHDPTSGTYADVLALDAASIVGEPSGERPDVLLVDPGHPERSYLLQKVLGRPGVSGTAMPPKDLYCSGAWPANRLCGSKDPGLRLLENWIRGLGSQGL